MEIEELKRALRETDPAAVMVAPRILRRVLQAEFKVPYLLVQVPHERCYFFDRQVLFRHVEQDELDLEQDRMLPPTVILLTRPPLEDMQTLGREAILSKYWRLLFHVRIHLALAEKLQAGTLTPADIRARIERIGQTEFEEIRTVLQQENDLIPPPDDVNVYVEFAAVYLELRYFRSNLIASYFPALGDTALIDQLLAQDVDAADLFVKTRLPGAPDPVIRTDTSSDESHDYYWRLMRHALRAGRDGDTVRAAVLRTKAARVAPPTLAQHTRGEALQDLKALTLHLQDALKFSTDEAPEWLHVLPSLLDKADQGHWPVEAKLLYDLQKICIEHERKLYALDVVEWGLSAGKRPIKRPLASLQIVRTTKHLRSAAQRLTMARVSDDDRQRLARLLRAALNDNEEHLRERFRPIIRDAFYDVGLAATSTPEQVALQKMIEELLDLIAEKGFFSFSDLRDTVSRNQLKLPDLLDPYSFWRGDPLLRLDRRLATVLEGVYRHGEFYLRWLESGSSLFFGTALGRFFTRNVAIPFGGAYGLIRGLEICINEYVGWDPTPPWFLFIFLGLFFLGLTHSPALRHALAESWHRSRRAVRYLVYEVPLSLWRLPWFQAVLISWPFLLLYWYVLKPLILCAAVWLWWPRTHSTPIWTLGTLIASSVLLNSRFGTAANEAMSETLVMIYGWLRFDLLRGFYRWVTYVFRRATELLEYLLYTVDEWLRFRSDEGRATMFMRAGLNLLWFPVGRLVRLYFVTFLEPTVNPIKLPLSSLAFKFMLLLPLYINMMRPGEYEDWLADFAPYWLSAVLYWTFLYPTAYLFPGAFIFLFWEMKENWRLFRANRPNRLKPVVVGKHGETMVQMLRPGFHSGTIPKLFGQLRTAERQAYRSGNWRSARTYRQALAEVARSIQLFVEREFLALLAQSKHWPAQAVGVNQVVLSCNRARVELGHADFPDIPVRLAFEERSRWLIGSVPEPGWVRQLTPEQLRTMTSALAGLYKIAGVDFVREQLSAALRPLVPNYDILGRYLILRPENRRVHELTYDLKERQSQLHALAINGADISRAPLLDVNQLFYSRIPLTWDQWVQCWQDDRNGQAHPALLSDRVKLLIAD